MSYVVTNYYPRGSSVEAPKYDFMRNPVYQVDFTATCSGKKIGLTKRRIRWRFGFASADAIANGATSTDCRGEEHEVSMVWSLTSGKRLVLADGNEVHFSSGRRGETKFETSWQMRGNHTFKIIAHAASPLVATPGFRQFDLQLDGQSFFDMPRIFELGIKHHSIVAEPVADVHSMAIAPYAYHPSATGAGYSNYSLPPREEDMTWARSMAVHENRRNFDRNMSAPINSTVVPEDQHERTVLPRSSSSPNTHLSSTPADLISDPDPTQETQDLLSATTPAAVATAVGVAPHQSFPTNTPMELVPADEFAPQPVVLAPPPSPPTFQDVSSEILGAYGTPTAVPPMQTEFLAIANEPHYYSNGAETQQEAARAAMVVSPSNSSMSASSTSNDFYTTSPPSPVLPVPQSSVVTPQQQQWQECGAGNLSPGQHQQVLFSTYEVPKSEMEKAMENLVNLDDITSEVQLEAEYKLTLMDNKNGNKKVKKNDKKKSSPLPPVEHSWALGESPSLDQIKAQQQSETMTRNPSPQKEVMHTYPNAFNASAAQEGMLVVYGQSPPPLSSTVSPGTGFGVVATMQQQQAYAAAY